MTTIKDKVVLAHFDERSIQWNQLYERSQFQDRLSLFVNKIKKNVPPQSMILDYGCGTGRIAIELATCGYQVKGVDGASGMIQKARSEAENQKLLLASFETIEPSTWRPPQQYDAIVCSSVLEYVPNDELLLFRFAEALVPGGILLVSIPYAFSLTGVIEDFFNFCRHIVSGHNHDVQFAHRRYTRSGFKKILNKVGFESPIWTSFEFPMFGHFGVRLSRIPILGVMLLANTRRCSLRIDI